MEARTQSTPAPANLSRRTRISLSVAIAWHLLAVVVGPATFSGSALAAKAYEPLGPWIEALRLGNGYRFFAPEPTPSHLVRYEAKGESGETMSGVVPDLATMRPRLYYHRHLVQAEFLSVLELAQSRDKGETPRRQLFRAFLESYARQLGRRLGATEVTLWMLTHRIPTIAAVQHGLRLDDPRLYRESPLGTFQVGGER